METAFREMWSSVMGLCTVNSLETGKFTIKTPAKQPRRNEEREGRREGIQIKGDHNDDS